MDFLNHFDHHSKKQDKDHFMNLIQVALSDGKIDQTELETLHRVGRKMSLTDHEIDDLIKATNKSTHNPPHEYFKRFEQVYEIVKIILADGVIDDNEMHLANVFASKSGFTDSEIPVLLDLLINGIKKGTDEEDLFEVYKKTRKK